jgi:hypothetical protein
MKKLFVVVMSLFAVIANNQAQTLKDAKILDEKNFFVISRVSKQPIFVPASKDTGSLAIDDVRDSLIAKESLKQLAAFPEIEALLLLSYEQKQESSSRQILDIWGVNQEFFSFFGLPKEARQFKDKKEILVSSALLKKNAWKVGDAVELLSSHPQAPKLAASIGAIDIASHPLLKRFERFAIMDVGYVNSLTKPNVLNPKLFVRFKANVDVAKAKDKLQHFLDETAQPGIKDFSFKLVPFEEAKF